MSGARETLIVEATGPGANALGPGVIQRALAVAGGVSAGEVGAIHPLGRGRAAVDVAVLRAERLATPRTLAMLDPDAPLLTLRRASDPPQERLADVHVSWGRGAAPPTVGALGRALSKATFGVLGAEDLGGAFVGQGWLRLRLPERAWFALKLPCDLSLDGDGRVHLEWAHAAAAGS